MTTLKQKAAALVAELMMAHYDGPFDDGEFYYDLMDGAGTEDQADGAKYFDVNKRKLHKDEEFRTMVASAVRKELLD